MVIKVYVSTISFSQEIKKNQQRAVMILESKNIPFVAIDITDPGQEDSKDYMNENAKPKGNNRVPMTPQIFNDAEYCGDFDDLDMSNETDSLGEFLKLTEEEKKGIKIGITGILPEDRAKAKQQSETPQLTNGVSASRENGAQEAATEATTEATETPAEPATEVTDEGLTDAVGDRDGEIETEVAEGEEAVEEDVGGGETAEGEEHEAAEEESEKEAEAFAEDKEVAADYKEADTEGGEETLDKVQTEDDDAEA
ncbi:SH3 domain-binding glutamic acid-rich protein-like isoform X1 [Homarus americanus]|uniref:SH3 domain-binding glutamic acid-rich protein-like isoform X1 n=1 Tax=Homarus americanus TaxID=6706 RepID=UPI001C46C8C9|nr:SH3 domain-binding glutamic acid-rich protein-like isoform X1 [Homarus americanus]